MNAAANHELWMAQAIRLARQGIYTTHPNPRVGCVIVKHNKCIAEGFHALAGEAHAEINALNSSDIPPQADIYVSLEPCAHIGKTPPCVDALVSVKPARVIIAMQDPNPQVAGRGIALLKKQGIEVIVGVLENVARELNCGFVSRMERNRPFVRLKMAMSLDARSALKNGQSQWITGAAARQNVQHLRAMSSAILTSANTVLKDDPSLNVRLKQGTRDSVIRHPVRVIVDSRLNVSGNEKIFGSEGDIWIYTSNSDRRLHDKLISRGARITLLGRCETGHLDLSQLMTDLARREINEIHTECGQLLAGALISQNLVDEIVIYMAPHLLGSQARGVFEIGELTRMDQRVNCKLKQIRQIGDDIRLTLALRPNL